jgi:hypothetical protein
MTTTDKRSLIFDSVMVTRIDIHPAEEEFDHHVVRTTLGVLRMTTVREVPTKSKSGPCSRDDVLAPNDAWLSRHPGLPHSPSNKPPQSKEVRFDKVVTGLLVLSGLIKPNMQSVQIMACHRGQNDVVLNRHRWGLPSRNLRIATALSSSFPSMCTTIP